MSRRRRKNKKRRENKRVKTYAVMCPACARGMLVGTMAAIRDEYYALAVHENQAGKRSTTVEPYRIDRSVVDVVLSCDNTNCEFTTSFESVDELLADVTPIVSDESNLFHIDGTNNAALPDEISEEEWERIREVHGLNDTPPSVNQEAVKTKAAQQNRKLLIGVLRQ